MPTIKAKCRACNGTGQAPLKSILRDVLRIFYRQNRLTSRTVVDELGIGQDQACKRLRALVALGFLATEKNPWGAGRMYFRTNKTK